MAATEADDEGLPHLWEGRRSKQQLTQTPSPEVSQKVVFWQCGQRHEFGDSKGFGGTKGQPLQQYQLNSSAVPIAHR